MYGKHPSPKLNEIFKEKPYQGQKPEFASVLIVGRDANYSEEITNKPFFAKILEYHDDGVSFWKRHEKHHPFLLPEYPLNRTGGGVPYHRNFAKMGLGSSFADKISFVELLNIPTTGITGKNVNKFFEMLDLHHLQELEDIFLNSGKKTVFISPKILEVLKRIHLNHGIFSWLFPINNELDKMDGLPVVYKKDALVMVGAYHFSSSDVHGQLAAIERIIKEKY
ncbi:MAG: hypothetical protein HQL07_07530 [Nitrospirae bacterium]|nr:hypothetical protein [Magnetococcales bacterium]